MRRALVILAIAVVAVVVSGYGAASAVVWDRLTRVDGNCHPEWAANDPTAFSDPDHPDVDTAAYAMPEPEDVSFPSRDAGLTISGWWIPSADQDAPAVVVVHGHTACKRDHDVLLPAGMLHCVRKRRYVTFAWAASRAATSRSDYHERRRKTW